MEHRKEKTHKRLRQQLIMCLVHGCESICTLEFNCITSMTTFKYNFRMEQLNL